ncbi:molybdenum ABC transporter ATP-binding protein [Pseudothauera rhizosphaerae]|uniref:molybdenum ABC transporter ATP-binding protein n=1 Tax=Pseudothauera rhizosphaerae TaxID=2565932 RepID=UPI001E37F80D|nr:molybdenum ABC transporter ATP-binding protein [Pseudothauera rhizosphaerae]
MSIVARFRLDRGDFVLDVDLDLPSHGVIALFGRSGSGKTTVLRCVAGLEHAPGGYLSVDGEVWQDGDRFLPVHKRPIGYVFQEGNLFPHLNAAANMRYGLDRTPPAERRVGWDEVVELFGIGHLLDRHPDQLSGGERQRVALARALLSSPRLLLMDEPLSALDHARKQEILPYLERLHDELDIPVLYVSHAPGEVARLADHVVLLEEGKAVACGTLRDTLSRLDLPTALAEDAGVVIEATVGAHDERYHLTRLDFPGGSVYVARRPEAVGSRLRFRVHARDVSLAFCRIEGTSITNLLPAVVTEVADADTPAHVLVRLEADGTPLIARITRRALDQLQIEPGLRMWAQIKTVALLA